jgi:hypothetical protein
MASEPSGQRWRGRYARLLRFYPAAFRDRFGEGMEQTFADLCRERRDAGEGLAGVVLWTFAETFVAIIRQNIARLMRDTMAQDSTRVLRTVKSSAILVSALMVVGILTLMVLARGKDEDITGIVAPAALVTLISGGVVVVVSILQKRHRQRRVAP